MPATIYENDQTEGITIFENPWPEVRPLKPLESAADDHIKLVEFFLRILPHFPRGEDGVITDEALAYSEWRYICYIRFLDAEGYSPHERPPPWDVAMIWYCHLMSPSRFQSHLWSHSHKAFGLDYHHFPISRLLDLSISNKWSDKTTERDFERWSTSKDVGYYLSYQFWPSAPWEQSSALARLFRRQPRTQPGRKIVKNPNGGRGRSSTTTEASDLPASHIYMPREERYACSLCSGPEDPSVFTIAEYARFRSGQVHRQCRAQHPSPSSPRSSIDSRSSATVSTACELTPWSCISHLKTALYRQAAFWNALSIAREAQPSFFSSEPDALSETDEIGVASTTTSSTIEQSVEDYKNFMTLMKRPIARVHRMSRFDPKSRTLKGLDPEARLMPPTLEVDLLWHTHRLFPGSYWTWCDDNVGQLVDCESAGGDAIFALKMTKQAWTSMGNGLFPQGTPIGHWEEHYVPGVATLATQTLHDDPNAPLETVLTGLLPRRRRKEAPRRIPQRRATTSSSSTCGTYAMSSSSLSVHRMPPPVHDWSSHRISKSADMATLTQTSTRSSYDGGSSGFRPIGEAIGEEKNWRISGFDW